MSIYHHKKEGAEANGSLPNLKEKLERDRWCLEIGKRVCEFYIINQEPELYPIKYNKYINGISQQI